MIVIIKYLVLLRLPSFINARYFHGRIASQSGFRVGRYSSFNSIYDKALFLTQRQRLVINAIETRISADPVYRDYPR